MVWDNGQQSAQEVRAVMRFGVNTMIWSGAFEPEKFPFAQLKEVGVDGIEIPVFVPTDLNPQAVRKTCEEHAMNLHFCSVNPDGMNPISDDDAVRAKTIAHWKTLIRTAAEAGADQIVGPTYSPVGYLPGRRRTEDEWKWGVEFHQALDEDLAQARVTMAVEPLNRFETYFLNTAADAVRFIEEIGSERIGILLDTFHQNIEDKDVADAYRTCGKHLMHVHTCENDRGVPGSGHVDWPGVLRAIKDTGYDRWLTIESFNSQIPELSAATAIWRDLADSMDDIAIDGTRFLRDLWART